MTPQFSIVIPTFNRGTTIKRSIDSVLKQDFKDIEIVIVDDGSTDDTSKILSQYIDDLRVRYLYQANNGVSAARNFGSMEAAGEYLIFLDSDDSIADHYIEEVIKVLGTKPDVIFVGASFYKNQLLVKEVLPSRPYGKLSDQGLWLAGTFIILRKLFLDSGGYDPAIRYGENTELSIRLLKLIRTKCFINQSLLEVHQANQRASASPLNLISSISYTLKKHEAYYENDHANKRVYLQILGVAFLRIKDYKNGKHYLWQAYKLAPYKVSTLLRFLSSVFSSYLNSISPLKKWGNRVIMIKKN